jgi:copper homeostasis protein (lipoprotein)
MQLKEIKPKSKKIINKPIKTTKTMRKIILLLMILFAVASACNTGKKTSSGTELSAEFAAEHSSRNSLDWAGVYRGTLPCADCEGIVTEIRLNSDNSFERIMDYLGKGDDKLRESGSFDWDETGGKIIITDKSSDTKEWYKVGENRLIALDIDGNRIESSIPQEKYVLNKIDIDNVVTEKYWKLIELNGKSIQSSANETGREAHFILHSNENRITGNSGCNNMMGSYELTEGSAQQGEIKFSPLAATRMACLDAEYEHEYLLIFDGSKKYSIENDTLSLFSDRDTPVAKFVAVYLR